MAPQPTPGTELPVNILLVDDEVRNLEALESFLTSPDYRLVRALSAQAALLLLLERDFAVIVLDVQMPGTNGIELANLIKQRKRTQHIPIIFLTAFFQEDKDVLEGYSLGAVDYLTKPINPQILKSKIGVFVELFRKTHALAASNAALELQVMQRQSAEEALQVANNELEIRVNLRTAELSRLNAELRVRETALRASEAHAQAASQAKDRFLAMLSHELRTPLNPVLLLATEAARDPDLPARVREDFQTIAQNIALEARLIDDLLDLTGIEQGKLSLKLEQCDIHEVVRDVLGLIRADVDAKRLNLQVKLDAPASAIKGDVVRLKQVLWNVVRNAVKFTPEGGSVTVQTMLFNDAPEFGLRVDDTGIGLTADEIGRIFQPFVQGDHVREPEKRGFGGLGLGLAICRRMMDLHSGSITATSAGRGQGTSFLIRLPLARASTGSRSPAEAAREASAAPFATSPAQPCRVLMVEDHLPTAKVLEKLLATRHYTVFVATSMGDALKIAEREQFDALISDIGLNDGDGCDLMVELRRSRPELPGIALTGYGMDEDVARSRAAGFHAHLTKPINVRDLERALGLLNGWNGTRVI
jgi:signal transduction histidine kinase